jgi:tRNA 5-methylaminomethyl-2-thiouridine biosynthesis bifunctional protein
MLKDQDFTGTALRWDEHGVPFSTRFGDQYFCRDNGYEEGFHVNCAGNALAERFRALYAGEGKTFTILETGFGTGLDFLIAWKLWDSLAPPSASLHFVSLDLYPLAVDDVRRALSRWPFLRAYKEALLGQYHPLRSGVQECSFNEQKVRLTIVFEHVAAALKKIRHLRLVPGGVDAWFLDGFAPSKNPDMWSEEVFSAMAPLSREGTTLATFTVAGRVCRGLKAQGFSLDKVPGYGQKRQVLRGYFVPSTGQRAL